MKARKWLLCAVAGLILLPIGLDYAYSVIIGHRMAKWEAGLERDEQGVRTDFAPFQTGRGEVGILFIHGFASSPALFSKMARVMAEQGYTCRVLRLPGFGETMEQSARIRARDWIAHVDDELDILLGDHDRVFLIGHSMGATLGLLAAQERSEPVRGLILLGPLFDVSNKRSPLIPARQWFQISEKLMIFTDVFETAFPIDAVDPAVQKLEQRDLFLPCSVYAEMLQVSRRARAMPSPADIPLLMVLATEDKVVDNEASESFFESYPSRDKAMYHHPMGHVIPLDRGWEDVTERVVQFIRDRE